jgi:XRE family transcriptional regulator, master regulator for biofilm formation
MYLGGTVLPRLDTMIRTLREAKGLSQVELARRAKVARPYLIRLESRQQKNPSLAVLKRLAKALGVSVPELLS